MTAQLPGAFAERMKELLGPEYEQFTDTYQQSPYGGIRANTLKITVDGLRERSPSPWSRFPGALRASIPERGPDPANTLIIMPGCTIFRSRVPWPRLNC